MKRRHTLRILFAAAFLAGALAAPAAVQAGGRAGPLKARLGLRDRLRLWKKASAHEAVVRDGHTPPVDFHIARASVRAGVRWRKVTRASRDQAQVFEVEGIDQAGGELHLVMTAPASGHVMQPKYGGRPWSVVEDYAANDIIYVTHKPPGAGGSEPILELQSRGLVTREGFTANVREKGEHTFWYFRGGRNARTFEGTEPGLRKVTFIVK